MSLYAFLITSLIIILILGTGVVYTVSLGMSEGRKNSVFAGSAVRRASCLICASASLFFSLLPQYVSSDSANYMFKSSLLGILFMALTFIVFVGYGCLAGTAKRGLCQSPRRMSFLQKCFRITFIAFAVKLAL